MVFSLRKKPADEVVEEPPAAGETRATPIDEKNEVVVASGVDVGQSLDQLKKFRKTHQWVCLSLSIRNNVMYATTGMLTNRNRI